MSTAVLAPKTDVTDVVGVSRWVTILPIAFVMYTIAYFDRANIGIALPYITADLHLTPTEAGLIGGMFAWGYAVTQLAAAWIILKLGSRAVVGWALILWGFGAIGTGLARNFYELSALRMLLGLFEGPVFAATSVLLSQWFMKPERGRAFGIWNLSSACGAFLAGPISGFLVAQYDWRVMMVVEGLPAWLWAVLWWWRIPSSLSKATWLPKEERELVERSIAAEQANLVPVKQTPWWSLLGEPAVWFTLAGFGLTNFLITGFQVWLPSALKQSSALTAFEIGIISGLPFLAGMAGVFLNSWHSDRNGQERRFHGAIPAMITGALLILAALVPTPLFWVQIALFVALGFTMKMYLPMVFSRLMEIYPKDKAIAATALISGLGNLFGGFVGPVLIGYIRQHTNDFVIPFVVLGAAGLLGGIFLSLVRSPARTA